MTLTWGWGSVRLDKLARRLRRTEKAVCEKAKRLGMGPRTRGQMTLAQFCERIGYSAATIQTLANRIHVHIRRNKARSKGASYHLVGDDAAERIIAELDRLGWPSQPNLKNPGGKWGVGGKPAGCLLCGTSTRPHQGRGLCSTCLRRENRAGRAQRWEQVRGVRRLEVRRLEVAA
jgi:hypothetical protein